MEETLVRRAYAELDGLCGMGLQRRACVLPVLLHIAPPAAVMEKNAKQVAQDRQAMVTSQQLICNKLEDIEKRLDKQKSRGLRWPHMLYT